MLYVDHFKLTEPPFQLGPDPRFFFASAAHKRAMAFLTYGLHQGEGFIVITGGIGTGKTTLVKQLLSQLDPAAYQVGFTAMSSFDPGGTLRMAASSLGIAEGKSEGGSDKAELAQRIAACLSAACKAGRRTLLVIDEVQNMPIASLEELRMLADTQIGNRIVLQCLLIGQPSFRETLARADLAQLQQRVTATCHLGPLGAEDTAAYIRHRLTHAGWRGDPDFTEDALRSIHQCTHGVPRKINTLCSRLLLLAFLEDMHVLGPDAVATIAAELEEELAGGAAPPAPEAAPPPNGPAPQVQALAERLTALERHVAIHDTTIRSSLDAVIRHLRADAAVPAARALERSVAHGGD